MRTDRVLFVSLLLILAQGAPAQGQWPLPTAPEEAPAKTAAELQAEQAKAKAAQAEAAKAAKAAKEKAEQEAKVAKAAAAKKAWDAKRLKAILTVRPDRRPSAVLAAWSKPEPLAFDKDPKLAMPKALPPAPKPPKPSPAKPVAGKPVAGKPVAGKPAPNAAKALAEFKKLQKAYQKKSVEHKKKKAEIEKKRLARVAEIFARDLTLGRWDRVRATLVSFKKEAAKKLYEQLLKKLAATPPVKGANPQTLQFGEKNTFSFEDILALTAIAPGGFDKKHVASFPALLQLAFSHGLSFEGWLERLREETKRDKKTRRVDRRMAARFVAAMKHDKELGAFLPTLDEAIAKKDREGLNLIARHFLALHAKDHKREFLENAWRATLAALAAGKIEEKQKTEALRRAVSLAPKVRNTLGDSWLEESFTKRPERGMEVLATIGAEASKSLVLKAQVPKYRLDGLKLLKTAVEALLEKAPKRAAKWRHSLNLLADVWLREAQHAYRYSQATRMGPMARRDSFGNIYWMNYGSDYYSTPVRPLEPGQLLELRPAGKWRAALTDSVRPHFDTTTAELYLKVNEEKLAFPFIERLAPANAKKANELAGEFLKVWIRNNDPNASRNRMNIYNFSYGYNQRASGIPLTRSKQERNLRDLARWVAKLRAVPNIKLDTKLIVKAFVASHSAAEVYRIETLERVFGNLDELEPKTLAEMAQTMRRNLATTWRVPAVQKKAGTKRKQKDIEAEVLKGYDMAQKTLAKVLDAHPGDWALLAARAAMIHDLINFQNRIQKTSQFAGKRRAALAMFGEAAAAYAKGIAKQRTDEASVEAFELWFHAALGASDIAAIDQETRLARDEIPKIKHALEAIPGEAGKRHLGMFANSLFTKLSAVNPAVKNRYLEAGFAIVGDNQQARAARKVYDYYKDLITEIQLVAQVDGSGDVGTEPFGVRVDLRYTKEIERESGGFSKYLQNQANKVNLYYNYGRPQINYRDNFEDATRTALSEQFEVLSVTFNNENVTSKADEEFGWRRTPYAYLLLKAKGAQIDRIPPLKVDLDFLDVTGSVVLPVTSPVVAIDASAKPEPRPYRDLEITQILDERKAKDGLLQLEIKASATGLVPELGAMLDLHPKGFAVEKVDDRKVAVSQFGDDQESIRSERVFLVSLRGKAGAGETTRFRFAAPTDEATKVLYQRYDDADLVAAKPEIELLGTYGEAGTPWWVWLAGSVVALGVLLLVWRARRRPAVAAATQAVHLPERITPFTVLGLLGEIQEAPGIGDPQREQLTATIQRIERYYFGEAKVGEGEAPDLGQIAAEWVGRRSAG